MSILNIPVELLPIICRDFPWYTVQYLGQTCKTFNKYMKMLTTTYTTSMRQQDDNYITIDVHIRSYPYIKREFIEEMTIGGETYDVINYRTGIYTILRFDKDKHTYGFIYIINGYAKYMIYVGIYNHKITTLHTDKYIHIYDFIIEWIRYETTESTTMCRNTSMEDILRKMLSKSCRYTSMVGQFVNIDRYMRLNQVIKQLFIDDTINKNVTEWLTAGRDTFY